MSDIGKNEVANSYNEHAVRWAERLRTGNNPAHYFLEKPAMYGKLPELNGSKILCVGCGSGEEIEMLLSRGASFIHGFDISESLIDIARKTFPQASFSVSAMEDRQPFEDEYFDFIYSSLTLHYSDDWKGILSEMRRLLRPGGRMLFSTHHPVKWGSQVIRGDEQDSFLMGYIRPKQGMPTVHGDYLGTRRIKDTWFGSMTVEYFHRPMSAIIRDIVASDFEILDLVEPMPINEAAVEQPGFWAIHSKIPLFMIFELIKK
jgi:ubiquinone/menaquinone biosynthesis C-methylase UbiE